MTLRYAVSKLIRVDLVLGADVFEFQPEKVEQKIVDCCSFINRFDRITHLSNYYNAAQVKSLDRGLKRMRAERAFEVR